MASASATLESVPADITPLETQAPTGRASTIHQLQGRIRAMQETRLDSRLIPTHPAIAELLPGGGLRQGAVYALENSMTLLLALLAAPSAAGSWCGVVGIPEFGVEAAASFGVDLARLVLVPGPGDRWLPVTAAIADVVTVVVAKPSRQISDGDLARLSARLRQRGSTLIVVGNGRTGAWPQSEALLSLSESSWNGIGDGFGHLAARQVTVTVSTRLGGRPRSARLWLPDSRSQVARVEPTGLASANPKSTGLALTDPESAGSILEPRLRAV